MYINCKFDLMQEEHLILEDLEIKEEKTLTIN